MRGKEKWKRRSYLTSSKIHFTSLLFFFSCSFSSSSLLVLLFKSYKNFKRNLEKKTHHMWLGFFGWCVGWSSHVGVQSFHVEGRNRLLISIYVLAFITYKHPIPHLLLMFGINWFWRSGVRKNNLNSNCWIENKELKAKLISKGSISKYWVTTVALENYKEPYNNFICLLFKS